jgi:flagella basal body P-ring formation protein FlgA
MMLSLSTLLLSGVTITLPMEAESFGTEIELGEIAQVSGPDAELVRRIEEIELGYAPAPGYSRLLRAEKILALLEQKLPDVPVRVRGHAATRVKPQIELIDPQEIRSVAHSELLVRSESSDVSFELSSPIAPVSIPAGGEEYRLRARMAGAELVSGRTSVPVEILVDGGVYRTVWTSWDVEVWRTMPVLAADVRAGEVLRADMFRRGRVRWSGDTGVKLLAESRLVGSIAARNLKQGALVSAVDVHRPVVVQLGEGLFLTVRKGAIRAKVPVMALESGAIGDRIRVRTMDSSKELHATVLNHDMAFIDLGS